MHVRRFRETESLAHQALDAGPSREMRARDFLRGAFACGMLFRVELTRRRSPTIGGEVRQTAGLQQRVEREEHLIFPATKDLRQDCAGVMVHGVPQPSWVACMANERPHCIHRSFARPRNVHGHLVWVQHAEQRGVDRLPQPH